MASILRGFSVTCLMLIGCSNKQNGESKNAPISVSPASIKLSLSKKLSETESSFVIDVTSLVSLNELKLKLDFFASQTMVVSDYTCRRDAGIPGYSYPNRKPFEGKNGYRNIDEEFRLGDTQVTVSDPAIHINSGANVYKGHCGDFAAGPGSAFMKAVGLATFIPRKDGIEMRVADPAACPNPAVFDRHGAGQSEVLSKWKFRSDISVGSVKAASVFIELAPQMDYIKLDGPTYTEFETKLEGLGLGLERRNAGLFVSDCTDFETKFPVIELHLSAEKVAKITPAIYVTTNENITDPNVRTHLPNPNSCVVAVTDFNEYSFQRGVTYLGDPFTKNFAFQLDAVNDKISFCTL